MLAHQDRLKTQLLGQFGIGGEVFAAVLKQHGSEFHFIFPRALRPSLNCEISKQFIQFFCGIRRFSLFSFLFSTL